MTITERRTTPCPDAETLASFADGRLRRQEMAKLLEHLEECNDCMAALEVANESRSAESPARSWWQRRPSMLAAAAVLVVALSLVIAGDRIGLRFGSEPPLERLIELAPRSARVAEPRLSGGFEWAAYRGAMRAQEGTTDAQRLKLAGAAGDLVERADRDRSAVAQHAAGVALVLIEKPLEAVERLRTAADSAPRDARTWSDLAAAQYAAALHLGRPSLIPEALVSADRALRLDPRLPEALFNRALILERLGLGREAINAWQAYLQVDPSSPWAAEARQRLSQIPAIPAESLFKRDLPAIESAAVSGDIHTIDRFVKQHALHVRVRGEAEHLGSWAAATQEGNDIEAARMLKIARGIGESLVRTTGESMLRDAVSAIDDADATRRALLVDAHVTYRRGRIAYSRQQLAAADTDLVRAATLFEQGRSPMSHVARYYAANVRFDRNDVRNATKALDALLSEANARPRFIALGAQVRWELALCRMVDGDWGGALPLLLESRTAFERLREGNHLGFIESLIADTYSSLGRPDEAWAARIHAFQLLSADGRGERLPVSIKAAARMELRRSQLETARLLFELERATAHTAENHVNAVDALVRAALVSIALGDHDAAGRNLRESAATAERIEDPSLRELALTHIQLATAATLVPSNAARASDILNRAIDAYGASGRTVFLPECYLLRGRAALRLGDRDGAAADFEKGVTLLDRSPVRPESIAGTGVLDAGSALFEEAIRLSLDRGDVDAAFRYAERSRAQLATGKEALIAGTSEMQKRLGTSGAALLQIVTLPAEIVVFCVTSDNVAVERRPMPRRNVARLVDRVSGTDSVGPLAELYDFVIRPFDVAIGRSRHLIIVADRLFSAVPFAALYDSATRRYLISRLTVSTAMSASTLRLLERNATDRSLLAIGLPSGEAVASVALPESVREIADIASAYPNAVTIGPDRATLASFVKAASLAGVIHIAGHTERQPGEAGTALLFTQQRVSWSTVAAERLRGAPIVVLAACETLRQRTSPGVQTFSLGAGFLAAGAGDVIGTLEPIADADARALFRSIHRRLAAGVAPAEALRSTQLEEIARAPDDGAWRSVALLTRSIG